MSSLVLSPHVIAGRSWLPKAVLSFFWLETGDGRDDLLAERFEGFYLVDVWHVEDEGLYTGLAHLAAQPDHLLRRHAVPREVDGAQSGAFDLLVVAPDVLAVPPQNIKLVADQVRPP
jgi:hypothetical protein